MSGVKKAWEQALAMILAMGMVVSLLPCRALAADAPAGQTIHEYIEVTGDQVLESGEIYAIVAPNAAHSILFHDHRSGEMSDQVKGKVSGNKLFLNTSSARFTEATQTWTIQAEDGGYTVSNMEDGHFLNFHTTSTNKVPVDENKQVLNIAKNPDGDGWSISAEVDGVTYYLHHDPTGQFTVNTLTEGDAPTYFHIYKQVATTLYVPEIPGYTLVTDATGSDLHDDRYYMFVGKGANGKMYALLPGDGTNSTDTPQPNLTAELTVSADGSSITAKRVSDGTPIADLSDLLFRSFHYTGGSDTFAAAKKTGRLLSLRESMFTNVAGSMAVTVGPYGRVTLHAGNGRYLGLNISGDATSSMPDESTGFYGPTTADNCPIYLFTRDGATIPEIDLTIPGYHRITSTAQLEIGSEYMIVSADSYGDLYALCPNPDGIGMIPGDAIDPDPEKHESYTSVTAQLTVDREAGTVTAQRLKGDGTPEGGSVDTMDPLHFTVNRTGNTFNVKYGENLYLAMVDAHFFTETPTELSITPDLTASTIYPFEGKFLVKDLHSGRNNARILDFNMIGDPIQFVSTDGENVIHTFDTNFWGPRIKRYPIYIYEYVGIETPDAPEIPATPERDKLRAVVDLLSGLNGDAYTPRSWEDFAAALRAAQALLASSNPSEADCEAVRGALRDAEDRLVLIAALLADPVPSGATEEQPLIADTVGGGKNFRSPALATLPDGTLVAAADARWDHADPAKGVDTVLSYSTDGGENWTYSFPNFFVDSVNEKNSKSANAATFTGSVMAAAGENSIYLLTNLFPGGAALESAPQKPAAVTGYAEIGGKQRLLVYSENIDGGQTGGNYDYYVGDFAGGFADLLNKADDQPSLYYVDEYYNLYRRERGVEDKVPEDDKLHCRQWDGDDAYGAKYVQQNLFFYSADFHVRNATYLWLMKGTFDGGGNTLTWSPTLLDPQVRVDLDVQPRFFGAGPGRGTVTGSGSIVLPVYTNTGDADADEHAGVIVSSDNGASWSRGGFLTGATSEAVPVAVGEDTIYLFTRHNNSYYVSTDSGLSWSGAKPTGAAYNAGCQLSAIRYSRKINGKDAILLSAPADAGSRTDGKLFVFLVEEDGELTLKGEYQVTGDYYGYSCLAELGAEGGDEGGDIALLYENSARNSASGTNASITFVTIPKESLFPAPTEVSLTVGESKTFPIPADSAVTNSDESIVTAAVAGSTLTLTGNAVGTAEVVVDDMLLYRVTVTAADPDPDDGGDEGGGNEGGGGIGGGSQHPPRPQPPADPVADCPRDSTCPIAGYTDAAPKAWYHDGVHYCVETGLMAGYGNEHWGPGDSLTRGMLIQILYNRAGKPAVTVEDPFTDVAPDAWYADAVAWGAAEGIVEGYGNGVFAPEQPVSRQDAVVILHRYAGKPAAGEDALDPFSDRDAIGPWAVEALCWAVEQGLIVGKGSATTLASQHHASRAEAAAILYRHFG